MKFWNKLVGFGNTFPSRRSARGSNRGRRQRTDSFSFAALEPRQLMAIDLVKDLSPNPSHSYPQEIIEVPGKGMAVVAIQDNAYELFTINNLGVRTLHQLNSKSVQPSQLMHHKDLGGNDWIYFSGTDGTDGLELYRLKFGTNSITRVKDVNTFGSSEPKDLTVVGNNIFFSAWNFATGRELWKTNGSASGTELVKDILPGLNNGSNPQELTKFGNALFFAATDGESGRELWHTNGTPQGTFMVKDVYGQTGSSNPRDLTVAGNKIFFSAFNRVVGREVWQSDGTSAGTSVLANLVPFSGSSSPEELTAWGDNLYFTASTAEKGRELYRYEPNVFMTTFLVKDMLPGPESSNPTDLTVSGNKLYFAATSPDKGRELWGSFGGNGSTEVVRDIVVGSNGSFPENLVDVDGRLYFSAFTTFGGFELYKSDGTTITTLLVKDINATATGASSYPDLLTAVNGKVVFKADDGVHGIELCSSDGTPQNTIVDNIELGTQDSYVSNLANIGTKVYFLAANRLFVTDSANGKVTELKGQGQDDSFGFIATHAVGNTLFFMKGSAASQFQLWKTTGTAASTVLVKELTGSMAGVLQMFGSGNLLYLVMYENDGTNQLWRSDGTTNGTSRLLTVAIQFKYITNLTNVNGRLFFIANVNGVQRLWRSDGTNATTNMFNTLTNPNSLVANGDQIYFFANDGTLSNFYRVNGLNAPLVIKANVVGLGSGIKINGVMYFSAYDGSTSSLQLLRSTGNPSETTLVTITNALAPNSAYNFHNVGGKLVFTATSNMFGTELWVSDGTDAGTKQLKNIASGSEGSQIVPLAVFENELYFNAFDGLAWAIWKSDGTTVGTKKVTEINHRFKKITDEIYPSIRRIQAVNNRLYFAATDQMFGQELFYFQN